MKQIIKAILILAIMCVFLCPGYAEPKYNIGGNAGFGEYEGWALGITFGYLFDKNSIVSIANHTAQEENWFSLDYIYKYLSGFYLGGGINYAYNRFDPILSLTKENELRLKGIMGYEFLKSASTSFIEYNLLFNNFKHRINFGYRFYF